MKRVILIRDDGTREEFQPDPDGVLWSYETSEGRRWIGWRALRDKIDRDLETKARGLDSLCLTCGGSGWHTAGGNEPMACGRCPAGEAWNERAFDETQHPKESA